MQLGDALGPARPDRSSALPEVGAEVYVRTLDRTGVLDSIDLEKQKAVVQFGPLPMTVALGDVAPAKKG